MQRNTLLTLVLGTILFLAHPAHAQFIGDRIRITTQHGTEIMGQIKSLDNTSLTILTDYSRELGSIELGIAYADMVQLQRSLGRRSSYKTGAVIGLGTGAFVGVVGATSAECNFEGCGSLRAMVLLISSGVGVLLGAIVGSATRTEKWERLDIPVQSAASVTPVIGVHPGGRLALGARISF